MNAIGIEFVVENLELAIELFVDVMGCRLISRGPAALIAGELATVDAGNIVISLIQLASSGEKSYLAQRPCQLSQVIFGADGREGVAATMERAVAAGLAIADLPGERFSIIPEAVRGALGIDVALVTVPVDDDV